MSLRNHFFHYFDKLLIAYGSLAADVIDPLREFFGHLEKLDSPSTVLVIERSRFVLFMRGAASRARKTDRHSFRCCVTDPAGRGSQAVVKRPKGGADA